MSQLLKNIEDKTLFKEVVTRLMERFKKRNGVGIKFGGFQFIIHDGDFIQIEDVLKDKSYFSESYRYEKPRAKRY